jgi:branched-chain amino acid aminotransferase
MRMIDGVVKDWSSHFERLRRGVEFIYGPFTEGSGWVALLKNALEAKYQNETGDKVLRLAVYREQSRGLLRSGVLSVSDLKIHLSVSPFDPSRGGERALKLRSCPGPVRPSWWPSYLKAGNYLETILSQKIHLKGDDDDVLFLSPRGMILESSVANIFIVKNHRLLTPPTGPNVLEGVMRKKVLKFSKEFFESAEEAEVSLEKAQRADAIFGSNSVRGLFLVDRLDDNAITYTEAFLQRFALLKDRVMNEET